MILGSQERAWSSSGAAGPRKSREPSQARSAASDAPFAHVAPHQLHATHEQTTPKPFPKPKPVTKSNIPLAAHISPPIMAMSRTPTPMLSGSRLRSPSVEFIDGPVTSSKGKSVDRLFGDDEDVVAVHSSLPKPKSPKKKSQRKSVVPRAPREDTPLHFPESEDETDPSASGSGKLSRNII